MKLPRISRITTDKMLMASNEDYTVVWAQKDIATIKVDDVVFQDMEQSLIFIDPAKSWSVQTESELSSGGYILTVPHELMNDAQLQNRIINEFRLFGTETIPVIKPAPGIAIRMQAILEMMEELITTELSHREEAIVSLLNAFFVYCDGQCNIQLNVDQSNRKTQLVHNYKQLVKENFKSLHEVTGYAELMNISSVYLNECVQSVLGYNAKSVVVEALVMAARQALKFSNLSIKEISYDLGFSSSDYFSTFFKNHTGITPSAYRKS